MIGTLTPQEIEDILMRNVVARLGCHADGQTYVVPITYALDGGRIVGHTMFGKKVRMMEANPEVCIEVDEVDDMTNWRSVIAQGTYRRLAGVEAGEAMGILIDRVSPLLNEEPHRGRAVTPDRLDGDGTEIVVYEVALKESTGRFEKSED